MDNYVDASLYAVEITPTSALVRLRELQDGRIEHSVGVGTTNHNLRETNKETLGVFTVTVAAIVVLKDLETACVRDVENLEIWVQLIETVEDRRSAERPLVSSDESAACDQSPQLVVLDRLGLIKNDAFEVHLMKDTSVLAVRLLPQFNLLLCSLTLDRWVVLPIRPHDLGVTSEDDVVGVHEWDDVS